MWACNDYLSDGDYDDWIYPNSPETDEEAEEAEEWREIELELFSRLHYDYPEELEGASNNFVPEKENSSGLSAGDPMKIIRRPLLRKTDARKDYHCGNCSEVGHLSSDCYHEPKPICILCGELDHLRQQCPHVFCYNCKFPGHRFAQCSSHKNSYVTCYRCEMFGHSQLDCPDLWRRYQYTTTRGPLIRSNCIANNRVYCYNCGEKGHYGYECMKDPMNSYIYWTYPFVVSYDTCWTYTENQNKRRKIETGKTPNGIPAARPKVIDIHKCTRRKRKFAEPNSANDFNSGSISAGSFKPKGSKKSSFAKIRRLKNAAMKKKLKAALYKDL